MSLIVAPPAIDPTNKLLKILNPEQKHKKIRDLQNDTAYIFYIYALTETGRGPVIYIEESTLPSSGKRAVSVVPIIVIIIVWGQHSRMNPSVSQSV